MRNSSFRWLVLVLAALAVTPRMLGLNTIGFSGDELSDIRDAASFVADPHVSGPVSDGYLNGQLPFFLIWLSRLAPESGRVLSAAAGAVCVVILGVIAVQRYGAKIGFIAAAFLALSPFHVSASRLAFSHGHILAGPAMLASLYFLMESESIAKVPQKCLALACFFVGVAVGTDLLTAYFAMLVAVLVIVNLFCRCRDRSATIVLGAACYFSLVAGVLVSSPMYLANLDGAYGDISARLDRWDSLNGYLWLGEKVERIGPEYYLVVLAAKLSPTVACLLLLGIIGFIKTRQIDGGILFCLAVVALAVVLLSIKGWKSPFYLTPFLPLIYLAVAASIHTGWTAVGGRAMRTGITILCLITPAWQVFTLVRFYPDYLMLGIQYGDKLYGEFQGPAVSHGQWIGNAMESIASATDGRPATVIIPRGATPLQFGYYAQRHGLTLTTIDQEGSLSASDFVIITYDARHLHAPLHPDVPKQNSKLLEAVEKALDRGEIELQTSFGTCGPRMAEVYRNQAVTSD